MQTLSSVDALAGNSAASNLLVLSLGSRRLVELNPTSGAVLSFFDLTSVTTQAIEGVTVDELGRIYLVAENVVGGAPSRLFELTPVPVPAAAWLFGSALAGLASFARNRRKNVIA